MFSSLLKGMIVSPSGEVMPSGPWSEMPLRPAGPLFRDRQRAEDRARRAIGHAKPVNTGKDTTYPLILPLSVATPIR